MSSAMNHSSMSDSVDWEDLMDISGSISNQDRHAADPPLPHPTLAQLKQRWAFRKTIQAESTLHRRIHAHAPSGRNILLTLRQRELRGCKHTVLANTGYSSKRKRSEERDGDDHGTIRSRSAYPTSLLSEIQYFAEYSSVTSFQTAFFHHLGGEDVPNANGERPSSSKAVSTISVAFSPDSRTMASTHGDHTVKITCSSSGILLQSLEGHPRTPWTVKYHPLRPEILASGCLGFQVRVWNWEQGQCLQMIRLDYAIISLSFHPTGNILAVASGSRLHFWDYDNFGGRLDNQGRKATTGVLTELEQHHMLRCVHFPPDGKTVIVGGINENDGLTLHARNRGGMTGGGISFYLRLWDFKMDVALHPDTRPPNVARGRRSPIDNARIIVPRALLYNDGGFDVSPDGSVLCACAEYWLPDGVNSAMELLEKEEQLLAKENENADPEYSVEEDNAYSPGTTKAILQCALVKSKSESDVSSPPLKKMQSPFSSLPSNFSFQSPPRERGSTAAPLKVPQRSRAGMPLPLTPPNPSRSQMPLSPPSPPGRRFPGGLGSNRNGNNNGRGHPRAPPPQRTVDAQDATDVSVSQSQPHPLSVIMGVSMVDIPQYVGLQPGRYVPHVVTVSLDASPLAPTSTVPPEQRGLMSSVARGHRPRLGQLLEACPLDGAKASAVTCVKFSPSSDFCLLGYGVREPVSENGEDSRFHAVTALYRVRGGMTHVSTMLSADDDVNIARFHPDSGYGFVYGTKQGRVRVLSPRPWNYYNC